MTIALQQVGIRQSKAELIAFRVDGTGTASILEGKYHGTLTDNGTGDYTITFDRPFRRTPVVVVTPVTANVMPRIAAVSATAVQITFVDNDGTPTATDADFHMMVVGYFSATER